MVDPGRGCEFEESASGFLPPASEGWGKVLFSVCLSVHTSMGWGYPVPGLDGGGYPIPGLGGGILHPADGYPIPGLGGGGGAGYQIQLMGGTPSQVWMGVSQGTPRQGLDGVHPPARI